VRGFLESLQYEVSGFGVRVHLIEPGFIRTDLATSTARDITAIADYDHLRARLESQWRESIARGMKREAVADRITWLLGNPRAPFRTRVGRDGIWVPRWKKIFPAKVFFAVARRRFGL
jgi:NAD(P)-dependent dehydrogenase (short-subunit alcohol dehydrogenase family)